MDAGIPLCLAGLSTEMAQPMPRGGAYTVTTHVRRRTRKAPTDTLAASCAAEHTPEKRNQPHRETRSMVMDTPGYDDVPDKENASHEGGKATPPVPANPSVASIPLRSPLHLRQWQSEPAATTTTTAAATASGPSARQQEHASMQIIHTRVAIRTPTASTPVLDYPHLLIGYAHQQRRRLLEPSCAASVVSVLTDVAQRRCERRVLDNRPARATATQPLSETSAVYASLEARDAVMAARRAERERLLLESLYYTYNSSGSNSGSGTYHPNHNSTTTTVAPPSCHRQQQQPPPHRGSVSHAAAHAPKHKPSTRGYFISPQRRRMGATPSPTPGPRTRPPSPTLSPIPALSEAATPSSTRRRSATTLPSTIRMRAGFEPHAGREQGTDLGHPQRSPSSARAVSSSLAPRQTNRRDASAFTPSLSPEVHAPSQGSPVALCRYGSANEGDSDGSSGRHRDLSASPDTAEVGQAGGLLPTTHVAAFHAKQRRLLDMMLSPGADSSREASAEARSPSFHQPMSAPPAAATNAAGGAEVSGRAAARVVAFYASEGTHCEGHGSLPSGSWSPSVPRPTVCLPVHRSEVSCDTLQPLQPSEAREASDARHAAGAEAVLTVAWPPSLPSSAGSQQSSDPPPVKDRTDNRGVPRLTEDRRSSPGSSGNGPVAPVFAFLEAPGAAAVDTFTEPTAASSTSRLDADVTLAFSPPRRSPSAAFPATPLLRSRRPPRGFSMEEESTSLSPVASPITTDVAAESLPQAEVTDEGQGGGGTAADDTASIGSVRATRLPAPWETERAACATTAPRRPTTGYISTDASVSLLLQQQQQRQPLQHRDGRVNSDMVMAPTNPLTASASDTERTTAHSSLTDSTPQNTLARFDHYRTPVSVRSREGRQPLPNGEAETSPAPPQDENDASYRDSRCSPAAHHRQVGEAHSPLAEVSDLLHTSLGASCSSPPSASAAATGATTQASVGKSSPFFQLYTAPEWAGSAHRPQRDASSMVVGAASTSVPQTPSALLSSVVRPPPSSTDTVPQTQENHAASLDVVRGSFLASAPEDSACVRRAPSPPDAVDKDPTVHEATSATEKEGTSDDVPVRPSGSLRSTSLSAGPQDFYTTLLTRGTLGSVGTPTRLSLSSSSVLLRHSHARHTGAARRASWAPVKRGRFSRASLLYRSSAEDPVLPSFTSASSPSLARRSSTFGSYRGGVAGLGIALDGAFAAAAAPSPSLSMPSMNPNSVNALSVATSSGSSERDDVLSRATQMEAVALKTPETARLMGSVELPGRGVPCKQPNPATTNPSPQTPQTSSRESDNGDENETAFTASRLSFMDRTQTPHHYRTDADTTLPLSPSKDDPRGRDSFLAGRPSRQSRSSGLGRRLSFATPASSVAARRAYASRYSAGKYRSAAHAVTLPTTHPSVSLSTAIASQLLSSPSPSGEVLRMSTSHGGGGSTTQRRRFSLFLRHMASEPDGAGHSTHHHHHRDGPDSNSSSGTFTSRRGSASLLPRSTFALWHTPASPSMAMTSVVAANAAAFSVVAPPTGHTSSHQSSTARSTSSPSATSGSRPASQAPHPSSVPPTWPSAWSHTRRLWWGSVPRSHSSSPPSPVALSFLSASKYSPAGHRRRFTGDEPTPYTLLKAAADHHASCTATPSPVTAAVSAAAARQAEHSSAQDSAPCGSVGVGSPVVRLPPALVGVAEDRGAAWPSSALSEHFERPMMGCAGAGAGGAAATTVAAAGAGLSSSTIPVLTGPSVGPLRVPPTDPETPLHPLQESHAHYQSSQQQPPQQQQQQQVWQTPLVRAIFARSVSLSASRRGVTSASLSLNPSERAAAAVSTSSTATSAAREASRQKSVSADSALSNGSSPHIVTGNHSRRHGCRDAGEVNGGVAAASGALELNSSEEREGSDRQPSEPLPLPPTCHRPLYLAGERESASCDRGAGEDMTV